MFAAYLKDTTTWRHILLHPIIRSSLEWIRMKAAITDYGEYNLGKPKWYANLHGYLTLPESECCWENHKHTIDIQYLINGKERIRWTSVNQLSTPRRYIEDKDRQEFDMPGFDTSQLTMEPGMFALFLPGDAHCPKIVFEEPEYLRKLVIKIPVDLLEK